MSVGVNLKAIRKRRGLTQGQLAELSGIQLTQVSRLENDDTDPKASTLFKLMDALKCSPDELMQGNVGENEPAYVKRVVKRIDELTPLRRFVLLDIIQSYCKDHTVNESDVTIAHSEDYDEVKSLIYDKSLESDLKTLESLVVETKS